MSIAQSLLPEFDYEMQNTRKMLERVPEDKLDYKPDPKSMSLGRLAGHVAEMASWGAVTLKRDSLDLAGGEFKALTATSRQQLLAEFDKNVADSRSALEQTSDADMMKTWTLFMGAQSLLSMPRVAVFRSMVMNHIIHHRAQLTVYYRLNGVAVPGMYGPSADEAMPAGAGN